MMYDKYLKPVFDIENEFINWVNSYFGKEIVKSAQIEYNRFVIRFKAGRDDIHIEIGKCNYFDVNEMSSRNDDSLLTVKYDSSTRKAVESDGIKSYLFDQEKAEYTRDNFITYHGSVLSEYVPKTITDAIVKFYTEYSNNFSIYELLDDLFTRLHSTPGYVNPVQLMRDVESHS